MMLRRSGRVCRPPRWLLLSSVPMESQGRASSQNTRASNGQQELAVQDQGSGDRDVRNSSQNTEWFVEHGNDYVQQQAILHAASPPPANAENRPMTVISQIEAIFESIAVDIQQSRELSIPYCRVRGIRNSNGRLRFPGRNVSEARSFVHLCGSYLNYPPSVARLLCILEMSHHALVTGNIVTKRNIFYQAKDLFRDQAVVDRLVDDLAFTLGVGRHSLNITATGKGLIIGPISFVLNNGTMVSCDNTGNEGTIICSTEGPGRIELPSARWVLIIEKEGKGYPDLNTRNLVYFLRDSCPQIPIYSLVDYDPDGIRILHTYKYGSSSLEHERQSAVNNIQWIGIRLSDVKQHHLRPCHNLLQDAGSQINVETHSGLNAGQIQSQPGFAMSRQNAFEVNTFQLTTRDRKLAHAMVSKLSGPSETRGEHEQDLCELQVMLMLNVKAEIQAVDTLGDITEWLNNKLCSQLMSA
ncbi:hypothetical protein PpBr36_07762 [Pyricularia pennisetigena]|uniref:hypothetical protein n=1 Tax=Pyricularia pennisetigena TaxID=1578925 RepID=UPI00114E8FBA|nr:hypothetical protein PpBr36_07762 [Pyricularia pennisetigena]TLS25943.1 hypothetical protein PpBr36_07762 [Pyricularia pennisetigena]